MSDDGDSMFGGGSAPIDVGSSEPAQKEVEDNDRSGNPKAARKSSTPQSVSEPVGAIVGYRQPRSQFNPVVNSVSNLLHLPVEILGSIIKQLDPVDREKFKLVLGGMKKSPYPVDLLFKEDGRLKQFEGPRLALRFPADCTYPEFKQRLLAINDANSLCIENLLGFEEHSLTYFRTDEIKQGPFKLVYLTVELLIAKSYEERFDAIQSIVDKLGPGKRKDRWFDEMQVNRIDVPKKIVMQSLIGFCIRFINLWPVAKKLMEEAAINPNRPDDTGTLPIYHVLNRDNEAKIIEGLNILNLRGKLKVNGHCCANRTQTPLICAITPRLHMDAVKWLIEHKADVNIKGDRGLTPLHLAVKHANLEMVRLLLTNNADVNTQNNVGNTPLHIALKEMRLIRVERSSMPFNEALSNAMFIVNSLLDMSPNVSLQNTMRDTPLHIALRILSPLDEVKGKRLLDSRLTVIKSIIDKGADLSLKNTESQTPRDIARLKLDEFYPKRTPDVSGINGVIAFLETLI